MQLSTTSGQRQLFVTTLRKQEISPIWFSQLCVQITGSSLVPKEMPPFELDPDLILQGVTLIVSRLPLMKDLP